MTMTKRLVTDGNQTLQEVLRIHIYPFSHHGFVENGGLEDDWRLSPFWGPGFHFHDCGRKGIGLTKETIT